MDDDWESLADKEIVVPPKIANLNKWEGEDDDEDVKDSWEDDEEKKDEEKEKPKPVPKKTPNKAQQAKLNEKERLKREEEERLEEERLAKLTPEEKLAEKLRLQQIEKENDLKSALETFGISTSLDSLNPESKEEFKEFADALSTRVSLYRSSQEFPNFVEDLVRSICANLSASELKKIKITVESLHTEKQKMEKQTTKKPIGKGKGKINLKMDHTDITEVVDYKYDYDYDDFM
ncbi:eukaryotic translation initiation factor 3 subunit J [Eupeodes corollae]|uniref:eukaryotic translation initiation factor 3 subunit J n=1 Tax=Eupeodes corollae TaxID=290404 RepID=UPI00248FEBFD|nr:eukaryotic translation initiation factor 3 subunit J [Eupeodes corollae]